MAEPATQDRRKLAIIIPSVARALLSLVEERGASPERLCRGLGFSYLDLRDQHLLLSYLQVRELVLRAERLLPDQALGLAVGARQTPVSWGVAGLAMYTCETFGDAIHYGLAHQSEAGAMVDHLLEERGREVYLESMPRQFDMQIDTFVVDEAMASMLAVSRSLLGPSFRPLRVDLAMQRPDHQEVYGRFYRCPLRFDAGGNRVTFESHWLGARLSGYDRIAAGLVQRQLNTLLSRPVGRQEQVAAAVTRRPAGIEAGLAQQYDGDRVNGAERTLRLHHGSQEAASRALRDSTLFERARALLGDSEMTVAQVARLVGYSDARAFRRAFKRWAGVLPNEFRGSGAS